jgi:polyhydroxybutyrate depolymerase
MRPRRGGERDRSLLDAVYRVRKGISAELLCSTPAWEEHVEPGFHWPTRWLRAGSILAALLWLPPGSGGAAETIALVVKGQARTALVERSRTPGPGPTIIMLHGLGGTPEGVAADTGLAQSAPPNGVTAVFPKASAAAWNRSFPGKEAPQTIEFFQQRGGVPDDIGFLKSLVAELIKRKIADPAQVYISGLSNGGFMALTMICAEAPLFAAAQLVVTSMIEQTGEDCHPAKPLPVVMLHGTADTSVPYGGGPVPAMDPKQPSPFSVWSVDRLISFFRRLNRCEGVPERSLLPGQNPQRVDIERSINCAGGPVLAYIVEGGTHQSTPRTVSSGRLFLDFIRGLPAVRTAQ